MKVLGLTGSIGMGKSTTAGLFRTRGVPVFDADAAVHMLYGGRLAPAIEAAFPGTATAGGVDRAKLAAALASRADGWAVLESIVHPAVRAEQNDFLESAAAAGHRLAVLDIPLLFETGRDTAMHRIAVVSCPPEVQRARVLQRPGMTPERFEAILARQMPDHEKRARAHFVIETGEGLESAAASVDAVIKAMLKDRADA